MEKSKYIAPSVEVHTLEVENMMALSTSNSGADNSEVLTNERDNIFTDIWGNEF